MIAALERYYGENTESVESIVTSMEEDAELAAAAARVAGNTVDLTSVEPYHATLTVQLVNGAPDPARATLTARF